MKADTSVKIKNKYNKARRTFIVIKIKFYRHYGNYSCQDIVTNLIT